MKIRTTILWILLLTCVIIVWVTCKQPVHTDTKPAPTCKDTVLSIAEVEPLSVRIPAADPDNDYLDWSILEGPIHGTTNIKDGTR